MANPVTEPRETVTPISYGVDDYELEVLIELMRTSGLSTPAAVLDLALWKLAQWYDVPLLPDAFDLGRRARRRRQDRADGPAV